MSQFKLYVGIDWGSQEHQVALVDAEGHQLSTFKVKHDGEAVERFVDELFKRIGDADASCIAASIEMTSEAITELLLERGVAVFGINPKQLDRFRDRHTVAGAKDDRRDAFVLADALRTDQPLFRRLELGDPVVVELREMTRARSALIDQETALANQLWQVVRRYFPQVLEIGSLHHDRWLSELLELAPTPASVKFLKRPKVEALLKRNHIRRISADEVLTALRKKPLHVAPGVVEAAKAHVLLIVPLLRTARVQRDEADKTIEQLLERSEATPEESDESEPPKKHRDIDIILSLPGVGTTIGATMLAEATSALAARDYDALRLRAGVAPVTRQTGKQRPQHVMRMACHGRLRDAMHIMSGIAAQHDPRLRALYERLRKSGKTVGRARRGVADRALAMLVAMLKANELYDPQRRRAGYTNPPTAPAAVAA